MSGNATTSLREVEVEAIACTRCSLAKTRTRVVFGAGDSSAALMFIGEAPGYHEDQQGIPFVGASGNLLTQLIEEIGLRRESVYIANVVKCRPPNNRDPLPNEIESCRSFLEAQVAYVDPRVVITLGNFATRCLLETKEGITRVRGREYLWKDRIALVPTFHPAAVLRGRGDALAQMRADFVLAKRALKRFREQEIGAGPSAPEAGREQ